MSEYWVVPPDEACPCGAVELSWADRKFGHQECGRRHASRSNVKSFDKHDGYQAHLAAHPGDKTAYTSGPWSKRALIDRRKREGWQQQTGAPGAKRPRVRGASSEALKDRVVRETMERKQRGELLAPGDE